MFTGMFAKMKGQQIREANRTARVSPPPTGQGDYEEVERAYSRHRDCDDEQTDNMQGFPAYPSNFDQRTPLPHPVPPCAGYDRSDCGES